MCLIEGGFQAFDSFNEKNLEFFFNFLVDFFEFHKKSVGKTIRRQEMGERG